MEDPQQETSKINEEMTSSLINEDNLGHFNKKDNDDGKRSNNEETNSTIEERYNKLRGFAVKLKKKVFDLTEQVKILEAEKEELQNKIFQISDSVKKLQTIQSQYDKLQDDVELVKNENKRLLKRLENLFLENDSLKDCVAGEKRETAALLLKIASLSEENTKLENTCEQSEKKIKELNNELKAELMLRQQKVKEYEELKNSLDIEVKAHQSTCARLDDIKHDQKSNNVLSLEVANYEISIESIKAKLDDEIKERQNLETSVFQQVETIDTLNSRITELQDSCLTKATRIATLEEENLSLESNAREDKLNVTKAINEKEIAIKESENLKIVNKDLEAKVGVLTSKIVKLEEENRSHIKMYESQIDNLKRELSCLNSVLENNKHETEALQVEFNNYKLRAQSVLLKTKNAPSNDLEEEVEHGKRQISLLNEKCENYNDRIGSLMKEILLLKDDRSRAAASEEELLSKLITLRQDSVTLLEKYKHKEIEMQRLQMNHEKVVDNLRRDYEENISNLKIKHEEDIQNVKIEVSLALAVNSPVVDETSVHHPANVPSSTPPLVEREECEGSESIELSPPTLRNVERNPQHRQSTSEVVIPHVTPLDQLLEFPFDENEVVVYPKAEDSPEIIAYKNRVKHLTELLADAEKDVDKLTQLNQILKDDLRRQKRYVEREKEAVNFEYLKNVVFKFVTLQNRDERSRLIPVLDTILKLSPEETQKLNEIVSNSGGVVQKRSWIPGWNTG